MKKVFSIVIKLTVQNYIKSRAFLLKKNKNKELRGVHSSPITPNTPPPHPPPTTTRKDNVLRAWQHSSFRHVCLSSFI